MRFSAPTGLIVLVSFIIAVGAILTSMGTINFIPLASVWIMTVAYAVLLVGCIIKGA